MHCFFNFMNLCSYLEAQTMISIGKSKFLEEVNAIFSHLNTILEDSQITKTENYEQEQIKKTQVFNGTSLINFAMNLVFENKEDFKKSLAKNTYNLPIGTSINEMDINESAVPDLDALNNATTDSNKKLNIGETSQLKIKSQKELIFPMKKQKSQPKKQSQIVRPKSKKNKKTKTITDNHKNTDSEDQKFDVQNTKEIKIIERNKETNKQIKDFNKEIMQIEQSKKELKMNISKLYDDSKSLSENIFKKNIEEKINYLKKEYISFKNDLDENCNKISLDFNEDVHQKEKLNTLANSLKNEATRVITIINTFNKQLANIIQKFTDFNFQHSLLKNNINILKNKYEKTNSFVDSFTENDVLMEEIKTKNDAYLEKFKKFIKMLTKILFDTEKNYEIYENIFKRRKYKNEKIKEVIKIFDDDKALILQDLLNFKFYLKPKMHSKSEIIYKLNNMNLLKDDTKTLFELNDICHEMHNSCTDLLFNDSIDSYLKKLITIKNLNLELIIKMNLSLINNNTDENKKITFMMKRINNLLNLFLNDIVNIVKEKSTDEYISIQNQIINLKNILDFYKLNAENEFYNNLSEKIELLNFHDKIKEDSEKNKDKKSIKSKQGYKYIHLNFSIENNLITKENFQTHSDDKIKRKQLDLYRNVKIMYKELIKNIENEIPIFLFYMIFENWFKIFQKNFSKIRRNPENKNFEIEFINYFRQVILFLQEHIAYLVNNDDVVINMDFYQAKILSYVIYRILNFMGMHNLNDENIKCLDEQNKKRYLQIYNKLKNMKNSKDKIFLFIKECENKQLSIQYNFKILIYEFKNLDPIYSNIKTLEENNNGNKIVVNIDLNTIEENQTIKKKLKRNLIQKNNHDICLENNKLFDSNLTLDIFEIAKKYANLSKKMIIDHNNIEDLILDSLKIVADTKEKIDILIDSDFENKQSKILKDKIISNFEIILTNQVNDLFIYNFRYINIQSDTKNEQSNILLTNFNITFSNTLDNRFLYSFKINKEEKKISDDAAFIITKFPIILISEEINQFHYLFAKCENMKDKNYILHLESLNEAIFTSKLYLLISSKNIYYYVFDLPK